jgi:hypothetical protein
MNKVELHDDGVRYLRETLNQGLGLAAALIGHICDNDSTYAFLPRTVEASAVIKFEQGGICTLGQSLKCLARHISALPPGLIVVQDIWATVSDLTSRENLWKKHFTVEDQLYFFENSRLLSENSLRALHAQVSSYLFIACYLPSEDEAPPRSAVVPAYLETIANLACEIYVSAYDQEGFVIWERSKT